MRVAGLGFRKEATIEALREVLTAVGGARGLDALATATDKAEAAIIVALAHELGLTIKPVSAEVLARAQRFFAERVPNSAAFLEKSGPNFVTLRGQGGEEVVISAWEDQEHGVTRIRASTLFFDQALDRFLSTLPLASPVEVA